MKKEIEELKKILEQSKSSDLSEQLNEQLENEKKKNEDLLKKLKDQFLCSNQLWQSGEKFLVPAVGGNNFHGYVV